MPPEEFNDLWKSVESWGLEYEVIALALAYVRREPELPLEDALRLAALDWDL